MTVGVPVMMQVPEIKLRPVGSAGLMPQVASATNEDGKTPVSR